MATRFPQRPESHQLEEKSERFFRNALPGNWTVDRPSNDYGVDLKVDIFEGTDATGLELLVQLKASAQANGTESESVQLKVSTYNLLWNKLQVVLLVKFIEAENEAYWILLKDIPSPPQDQDTFTAHIPRGNRISNITWAGIVQYVRTVTDTKLAAMRAYQLRNGVAQ